MRGGVNLVQFCNQINNWLIQKEEHHVQRRICEEAIMRYQDRIYRRAQIALNACYRIEFVLAVGIIKAVKLLRMRKKLKRDE